jgi:hypothetical protein
MMLIGTDHQSRGLKLMNSIATVKQRGGFQDLIGCKTAWT